MKMMQLQVAHSLPIDESKKRVEALLAYWKRKYAVDSNWNANTAKITGKAMGTSIDGTLEVLNTAIAMQAPDPGMLLRGQAQKYLTRKLSHYLNATQTLEEILKGES
jgi:Putative polyhydroxyalkanoic acid system protein (PHA_gran_rgn)